VARSARDLGVVINRRLTIADTRFVGLLFDVLSPTTD